MTMASESETHVSRALWAFCIRWAKQLTDKQQAEWIPDLGGTGPLTQAQEHEIALQILDWYLRVHVPAWLDLCPTTRQYADQLRSHAPVTDENACEFAPINCAAMDAANAAAMDAAGDATWDAAGHAAAAAATWAARDAARAAANAAAGDAAGSAARVAARAAAWAATREKLQPTTETLQRSAAHLARELAEQCRWWVDHDAECDRQLAAATCDEERDRAVGRYESEVAAHVHIRGEFTRNWAPNSI